MREFRRSDYEYDVCLSFAGEQRAFVEGVAGLLRERGVRVFYDAYEKADLWGKDLYEHLDRIYRKASIYCVIFVSKDYKEKVWARHERRSAQARAVSANSEYILPVRFDDTEIPGLLPTVAYVDLRVTNYEELASLIVQKVSNEREARDQPAQETKRAVQLAHNPHVLLGEGELSCRADELAMLTRWLEQDERHSVMCVLAPGGQGKSALSWTFFEQVHKASLWYSFDFEADHYSSLTTSLRSFASALAGTSNSPELEFALERIDSQPTLIILDGLDRLYGLSGRVEDAGSLPHRTIADLRVEGLIRRLAGSSSARLVLTARLAPAFVDDPTVARRLRRLNLGAIRSEEAADFWINMGIDGMTADYATATAALRGSPLLMRTAARWVIARGGGENGIQKWLEANPDFLSGLSGNTEFQRAALVEVIRDVVGAERQMLLALAASRRRLLLEDWQTLGSAFTHDGQSASRLSLAPGELLALGLVYRRDDGRYEMHEVVAEAILRTADDGDLDRVYHQLDDQYGRRIFIPGLGGLDDYDPDMPIESLEDLERKIGYYLSLLDRGLFADAHHVLYESLYMPLRFRLGELRALLSLVAQFRAAWSRKTGKIDHSFDNLQGEIALFDDRPEETLRLLADQDDPETVRMRAEAHARIRDFAPAYEGAQDACYLALRKQSLVRGADYSGFQLLGEKMFHDEIHAMIGLALALRTLARVLDGAGFRRAATLAAAGAVGLVEGSDQPGITSMAYEVLGQVALNAGQTAGARMCADRAAAEAKAMKVAEHIINAEYLNIRVQSRTGDLERLSERVLELVTSTARLGFGAIAHECLHIAADLGLGDTWLADAGRWRYPRVDTPVPSMSGSLLDELRNLRPQHPVGRWMELMLLDCVVAQYERLPDYVQAICDDVLGDLAGCTAAIRHDIGADQSSDGFLLTLAEDSSDEDALKALAARFPDGGDEDVYRAAGEGVYHLAHSSALRTCLLRSARRLGKLREAILLLLSIGDAQVQTCAIALDVANALREAGDYQTSILVADGGHRSSHSMMLSTGNQIATIVGAGLDLLKVGLEPSAVVTMVKGAFAGRPLIYHYNSEDSLANVSGMKLLGGKRGSDADIRGSAQNWLRSVEEQRMAVTNDEIPTGSAAHLAIGAFARFAEQASVDLVPESADTLSWTVESLKQISGHDEAVEAMIGYLRQTR